MTFSLDQILPSLQAFGFLSYWLIGLASLLEAFFISGVVVPGTLVVDAGGMLVQRGLLDFFDLAWFVALGSVLGSELSYWFGKLAIHRLPGRNRLGDSAGFYRAKGLFEKRGGMALVVGRFLGPVAGLVPLVAGMAEMDRRKFLIWNILGSIPYALAHVAIGYFLGDVMGRIGGSLTRVSVLFGIVILALLVLWATLYSSLRLLPLVWAVLSAALRNVADLPVVRRWINDYPAVAGWVKARLDHSAFSGLTLSILAVILIYIGTVWLVSVFEFLHGSPLFGLDNRLSELIHHFQSPGPIKIASFVTAVGGWQVVLPIILATLIWLMTERQSALAVGMTVSIVGSSLSVALLKLAFGRPRSPLGIFAETSASFPSGHAAASVAAYGILMYVVWRAGRLRPETSLLLAGLIAFAIGCSRIYLIEHYLSDVLNGWLVGSLWATVGIAFSEWRLSLAPAASKPIRGFPKCVAIAVVVGLTILAASNIWQYDHPRNVPIQVIDQVIADPSKLGQMGLVSQTESLLGTQLHPISIVIFAKDETVITDAIVATGWSVSRHPLRRLIIDAVLAALERSEDPTVETISHFWRGQPNDLAFVQSDIEAKASASSPEIRLWRTEFVTIDGLRAFFGTFGDDELNVPKGEFTVSGSDLALRDAFVTGMQKIGASLTAPSILSEHQTVKPVPIVVLKLQ